MKKTTFKHYFTTSGSVHLAKVTFSLVFMLVIFSLMILPQLKANYFYKSTTCLITAKKLVPLATKVRTSDYTPKFLAIYKVDKQLYTAWAYDILNTIYAKPEAEKILTSDFQNDRYYVCWYAAHDPHQLILKRGWDHTSLVFFFMTCFVSFLSLVSAYRWLRTKRLEHIKYTEMVKTDSNIIK